VTRALDHLLIVDLTRVLAGPMATQILADLGARVIKIERPGQGDDTRIYPPFLTDAAGHPTSESAYYLALNRNKESVAVNFSTAEGQAILHALLARADVLVENFKVGTLAKYGLSHADLKDRYPRLIYCSVTGFGQTGPLATEPGYDFLAQGMSGLMAATGAPGSRPTKVGVAVADYTTGLYATIGILAALAAREKTGQGQHLDISLLDCTVALMTHVAQDYLTTGQVPEKVGNAHAAIVPYQDFETANGHVIIAAGNDHLFTVLAQTMKHPEWATDPRFHTNAARVEHRDILLNLMIPVLKEHPTSYWVDQCRAADVPVAPIYRMDQTFADPQVVARGMAASLYHPVAGREVQVLASPLKLSGTPVRPPAAPPALGAQTHDVLQKDLGMDQKAIDLLKSGGVIH
jgi:crotonobetainyl-CoA:carnitine CoA-transferase CaiB-like acyl-CoA transferase